MNHTRNPYVHTWIHVWMHDEYISCENDSVRDIRLRMNSSDDGNVHVCSPWWWRRGEDTMHWWRYDDSRTSMLRIFFWKMVRWITVHRTAIRAHEIRQPVIQPNPQGPTTVASVQSPTTSNLLVIIIGGETWWWWGAVSRIHSVHHWPFIIGRTCRLQNFTWTCMCVHLPNTWCSREFTRLMVPPSTSTFQLMNEPRMMFRYGHSRAVAKSSRAAASSATFKYMSRSTT